MLGTLLSFPRGPLSPPLFQETRTRMIEGKEGNHHMPSTGLRYLVNITECLIPILYWSPVVLAWWLRTWLASGNGPNLSVSWTPGVSIALVTWILLPLGGKTQARIVGGPVRLGSLVSHTCRVGGRERPSGCHKERIGVLDFISLLFI